MAYKAIAKGVSLAADHAKYITWLSLDTAGRQAAYAALDSPKKISSSREPGYIVPFSTGAAGLVYFPAKILSVTQGGANPTLSEAVQQILANYNFNETEFGALSTPNALGNVKKFKFAKLTITARESTATAKSASRITGRNYYRNRTNSVTGHFGKKLVADTYASVVTAIEAEANFVTLTSGTNSKNKYRFVPEP